MLDEKATFLRSILAGERRRAESYARRVTEQHGVPALYEAVVRPALEDVGALWHSGAITVADEHLATATAQSAIAALYPLVPWPARGRAVAVIACPEGERHDLGARMVADLLALDEWDERFLGADVPVEDLARKVRALRPRLVCLSVTLPFHLPALRSAIALIRASSPNVNLLVGGRATVDQPDVPESLGADAVARSASEAVEVARGWK